MAAVERLMVLVPVFCIILGISVLCFADEVTLETSKNCYAVGETVYFTVTNGLSDWIAFIHDPIYEIRDSTGTEIFPVMHGEWLVYFEPGHAETFSWTQEHAGGWQVPEGRYHITATWFIDGGGPFLQGVLADTLWIMQTSGVEPANCLPWGRIKALFK